MNTVILIGRLVRDPDVRDTQSGMKIARFTLAIDRPTKGEDKQADFPSVVCFGKTAENVGRYMSKGRQVAVEGRIQTGQYTNQDGVTVYTTEVAANRVEFVNTGRQSTGDHLKDAVYDSVERHADDAPSADDFEAINEEVPF